METLVVKEEGSDVTEAESSKVPRVEDQIGVRTRAERSSCMKIGEAPESYSCGNWKRARARMEVFSVVLEDTDLRSKKKYGFELYFGVLLLHSCKRNFTIFDSPVLGPPQINPEGLLTLTGPKCSVPVEDEVLLLPWLIIPFICAMNTYEHSLWKANVDGMDRLICKTIKCSFQLDLHVSFAVYRDPMEAHLDIYFMDLEYGEEEDALFQVGGTVTASNNFLPDPKAKSILFHKLSRECVSLKSGKSVPLPLSRRMTVVPRKSTLLVHVNLQVCMGHGDPLPFEGTVKFNPCSDYAEEFIILPNHGKLLVKVTWAECEDRLE